MKKGWIWPVLVTAALAFTVGVNVVMVFAANADPNGTVTEPDYYRKAVEWDRTLARRAESERLGWRARATLGPLTDSAGRAATRELRVALTDSLGQAVRGANVVVTLIHNSDAGHPVHGALHENASAGGAYLAAVPAHRRGLWEVRVEVNRGEERFYASLRTDAF